MPPQFKSDSPERVLPFEDALNEVIAHTKRVGKVRREEEYVLLSEAVGRILDADLSADRDQPPFHRSTRDGFAIRSTNASKAHAVIGSIRAGERWNGPDLDDGQAIEIMTGAPVPAGADAVVMVEHTIRDGDQVTIGRDKLPKPGQNIVPQGAEARGGQTILPAGRKIGAAEIGVIASVGKATIGVTAKPTVAIVATGDELIELPADQRIENWQIYNSNSYALSALVGAEGGTPERLPVARDTMDDLRDRIDQGRNADLLLLTGGVSMGKYDLVEQALAEHDAEFIFTGALIQPGKPIVFGKLPARTHPSFGTPQPERYFFGLPGNPVSAQVCFHLFVAPMLRALCGNRELSTRFVEARLAEPVKGGAKVTRFLPAEIESDWKETTVRLVGWQGSGDVTANARGDGYAVLPAGEADFAAGQTVRVLLR